MFLGVLDPDPGPLVRGTDPDQTSATIIKKKSKKNLDHTVLCLLYDFLSLKNVANVASKSTGNKQKNWKLILNRHLEGHGRK
jgi:hypothetical protein